LKPIRLIAGFLTVGVWTLASRVLGFVRDILIAAQLGAGPVAEAFLIAFSLPNMFRRFFAEAPSTPPSCRCSRKSSKPAKTPRILPATHWRGWPPS